MRPANPRRERIDGAIERIRGWMREHDAPLLADNLAPGATPEALARAEERFGFPIPEDLVALWSLHDGQETEQNGFVENLDLLGWEHSRMEHEGVLMFVQFLRETPRDWEEAGVTREELASSHWFAFAARDSDSLVVSGVTGRVFSCGKDVPPLRLLAPSFADWLEQYAASIVADDYEVEEGFGDYYLQLRDRDAERRQAEGDARAAEEMRIRQNTPLLEQLQKTIAQRDVDRCQGVLVEAQGGSDQRAFHEAVATMFAATPEPRFIAAVVRPLLKALVLGPDEWASVAVGGALIGNNAIRDTAISRCEGLSKARLEELEATAGRATGAERSNLEEVLRRLRAKS